MFDKKFFASKIRVERAKRKWTQAELAEKIGVSEASVKIWEDETRPTNPSFDTVCVIADVCECSIQDFAAPQPTTNQFAQHMAESAIATMASAGTPKEA